MKVAQLVEETFSQNPDEVFSSADIAAQISVVFPQQKIRSQSIWQILNRLVRKGIIQRIKHGLYQLTEYERARNEF